MKIKGLNFTVREDSTDESIVRNVVGSDEYSARDLIEPENIVVDIGGHIGSFSKLASSLGARVITYEPFIESFDLLVENMAGEGVQYNKAVMGDRTPRQLHVHNVNFGGTNFYQAPTHEAVIQCITLDDVFTENNLDHIDFLKLDCEGAEYEILKNTTRLLDIETIAFEYVGSERRDEMLTLLRNDFNVIRDKHNNSFGTVVMKRK